MSNKLVGLDFNNPVSVEGGKHADHTGWAWDRDGQAYVLTLHDEDDNVLAVACYTYENWLNVFERLKQAHASVVGRDA